MNRFSILCWRAGYAATERRDAHIAFGRNWRAAGWCMVLGLLAWLPKGLR